ncbi:MAG: lantibiotic dehydratase [Thermoanaerobaculia bacterium]
MKGRRFAPAGFFAFRTPLLPHEELERFGEDLAAPGAPDAGLDAAIAADRARLRERLGELLERPEVREAIYVASPTVWKEGVAAWRWAPDSKDGLRAERALVRYLVRMASRATPFGLFAASSVGRIAAPEGEATRIRLVGRGDYGRHTRLDMDYLFGLAEDLERDDALARELQYRPNSSLYRAGGRLRYAEGRLDGKLRSYHLVAVEPSEYLLRTLARAAEGATVDELAAGLVQDDAEVEPEEAEAFVRELVESQILVAGLTPLITVGDAVEELARRLAEHSAAVDHAGHLREARRRVRALDETPGGNDPSAYRALARLLDESLPTPVEPSRLVQVDSVKPVEEAVLGAEVLSEIERGVHLLRCLAGPVVQEGFDRFKQAFAERFGERREVPLVEVLDEEIGIGFERTAGPAAEVSPLLAGLTFPPRGPAETRVPWGPRQAYLLHRAHRALAAGEAVLDLGEGDLEILAGGRDEEPPPLPDAFHVMAEVAAASAQDLNAGDFLVHVRNVGGPSGARLLGRFCHLDRELEDGVRRHLAQEEALRPEAVFAEVVHLPQGRIGNILTRPALRAWEIPFLGRASVGEEHRIPVTDLRVSVVEGRVVLTSERLGREVVPRLTTAHNFLGRSLGTYRFLCALQAQGVQGGLAWSWGALDAAPYLPRVTAGRVVLSRARWRLTRREVDRLTGNLTKKGAGGGATVSAARELRRDRGLPRRAVLLGGDNELVVDFENVLSLEAMVDLLQDRGEVVLCELFPGPDELWVRGPEGRFVHEILVPYAAVDSSKPGRGPGVRVAERRHRESVRESFPPGSEWLFAKLHTGTSTADKVLQDVVLPVVRESRSACDGWFFMRYADPDTHLRVRFNGAPEALHLEVLPRLYTAAAPLLDDGRLWALRFDTYRRETARYGGPAGIALAERLFAADSDAVLAIVATLEGEEGTDARWRLALLGAHRLLEDLGFDLEGRLRVATRLRESWTREFRADLRLKRQLGDRHRKERAAIEAVLGRTPEAEAAYGPGYAAFDRRSRELAPTVAELRRRDAAGRLEASVEQMAPSFLHMHANRLIRGEPRSHELVLYELLYRHYRAELGRARAKGR